MTTLIQNIQHQLDEQYEETVRWRRHLHAHPELSFQEENTAQFILNELKNIDVEVRENVGGYGIVATLKGAFDGPTIAFRADFDALPIPDLKTVSYKSQNEGVSHACGHDGHSSALLGFAKVIAKQKEEIHGTIVFIFQPAEETPPGGAKFMIEDGALDGVDVIYGIHLDSSNPVGTISIGEGYKMAAVDKFKITLQGKGGHGAHPHDTIDALVLGAKVVNDLQQIVARRVDPFSPAVVTIGVFKAGSAFNVIADSAVIEGTVRTMSSTVRKEIQDEIYAIVDGAVSAAHATAEIDYLNGYPALYNHPKESALATEICKEKLPQYNTQSLTAGMGGEDFAYYLEEKPGSFIKIGSNDHTERTKFPHHHPKFDIDEESLKISQYVFAELAAHYVLK